MDEKIKEQWCHAPETKRPSKWGHMLNAKLGEVAVIVLIYTIMHEFHLVRNGPQWNFSPYITIGRLLIAKQDGK